MKYMLAVALLCVTPVFAQEHCDQPCKKAVKSCIEMCKKSCAEACKKTGDCTENCCDDATRGCACNKPKPRHDEMNDDSRDNRDEEVSESETAE